MIAFLNTVAELGGLNALTFLVLFFFAFREGYSFCVWVKTEVLDKYHNKKNKSENAEETFEMLKAMNLKEDKEIEYLKEQIENLKIQQEKCKNDSREYHLAIARNTLYHIYNRCKKYGYIDQAEYESFESLKKIYLDNGGNFLFKNKIIPFIEASTIKGIEFSDDREIEE